MRHALRTASVAVAAAFLLAGCGEQSSESITGTGPGVQASHKQIAEPGLSVRDISGIDATDFTSAGTGTEDGEATISLDVPGNSVEAVYLYWARRLPRDPHTEDLPPAEILVEGSTVEADQTYGPVETSGGGETPITYVAQLSTGLVSSGSNAITVEDEVDGALGASLLVFYDSDDSPAGLALYDGVDFLWWNADDKFSQLASARPVTFNVDKADVSRSATLRLLIGDVEPEQDENFTTKLRLTIGGETEMVDNPFFGAEGEDWDDYSRSIEIPAGVTEVTVEPISPDGNGESMVWTMAGLSVQPPEGGEGCTPGYWKQEHHEDSWPSAYDPGDAFTSVFYGDFSFVRPEHRTDPSELSLSEALDLRGGDVNALTRHAVAALLNAASEDVSYDLTTDQVTSMFKAAVDGGDVEGTKDKLEGYNEQGCPLD